MNCIRPTLKLNFLSFVDKDRENEKEKKSVVSPSFMCTLQRRIIERASEQGDYIYTGRERGE